MSDYKELKPCPFCGEERIMHMRGDYGNLHWGFCKSCKCEGPVAMGWDEAKELWNTRAK
jgi:Lar family restriction alleviation protein